MFWGLVFVFLYVLYVYDRAIDILEFWKRVTTGSKVLTIWGQILRSRIVQDFNEIMTWINTVFGSLIGCVTTGNAMIRHVYAPLRATGEFTEQFGHHACAHGTQ